MVVENVKGNLLDFKVICSESGVVNLQHVASVVCNLVKDLEGRIVANYCFDIIPSLSVQNSVPVSRSSPLLQRIVQFI